MSLLIVEAIVTNGFAIAGTAGQAWVTVSVTADDGRPVTTLTQNNFKVGDTWGHQRLDVQGFQGGSVQIGVGAYNAGGLYMFALTPIAGTTWLGQSSYHIVIAVRHGNDHGQTIAELTIP
ncbi:MAG: hypothetical protein WB037_10880 [Pseudolabrys sp.]|jgi:hypothetical protein